MPNNRIKEYAKTKKVKLWEIAEILGMQDTNFSKKLRFKLDQKEEEEIMGIIDLISEEKMEVKS